MFGKKLAILALVTVATAGCGSTQTESTPQSQPQTQTAKEAEFDLALQMVNQHPKLQRQVCVALASGANKKLLKTKFQEGYEQGNPNNFPRSSFVWLALETNC